MLIAWPHTSKDQCLFELLQTPVQVTIVCIDRDHKRRFGT
jgi:hypothetical protein